VSGAEQQSTYLLDTSVVIALGDLAGAQLPDEPAISAVTLAELAAGPHATDGAQERARRQDRLQRTESPSDPLPFDAGAARAYGRIYAATRRAGREPRRAPAMDLLIATVALANDLPLFTRDPDDLVHLRAIGLEVHAVRRLDDPRYATAVMTGASAVGGRHPRPSPSVSGWRTDLDRCARLEGGSIDKDPDPPQGPARPWR